MARAKYFTNAFKLNGAAVEIVPNTNVTVYEPGTTNPLAQVLYRGPTGTAPANILGNPFQTDAFGNIEFWLDAAQRVDLQAAGAGVSLVADYEPVMPDPRDLLVNHGAVAVGLDGYGAGTETFPLTVKNAYTGLRRIAVTAGGSGYTAAPSVGISGGGGSGAAATSTVNTSTVTAVVITNGGTGYATPPTVTITGGGGSGATAYSTLALGVVNQVVVTNPGSGYTSTPVVGFSGGGGSGAAAAAQRGSVTAITVTNPGTGYTSTPTITFTGGGGSGAAGVADVGDPQFKILNRAGGTVFEVGHLGNGAYAGDMAVWTPHLVASNVRNWVPFNGVTFAYTNLGVGANGPFVSFVSSYQASSQPANGFNGNVLIPDDSAGSFVTFVMNTEAGAPQNADGGFRATEHELIIYHGTGLGRDCFSAQVGVHTAAAKVSSYKVAITGAGVATTVYGDVGVGILSLDQSGLTGWGSPRPAQAGVLVGGNPGHEYAYIALGTSNQVLWAVNGQDGTQHTKAVLPLASGLYTLGISTKMYGQVWSNIFAANPGSAASPAYALGPAFATGLFGLAGGGVGVTVGGTEYVHVTSGGVLGFSNAGGAQNFPLGGAGAATLGGVNSGAPAGAGPTTPAQVSWLKVDVSGFNRYIPLWQ